MVYTGTTKVFPQCGKLLGWSGGQLIVSKAEVRVELLLEDSRCADMM